MSWKARIDHDFMDLKVYLWYSSHDGIHVMQGDGSEVKIKEGGELPKPTFVLPNNMAAQALLESLMANGVKPKDLGRIEGELDATKIHLEDMRRLVFKEKP